MKKFRFGKTLWFDIGALIIITAGFIIDCIFFRNESPIKLDVCLKDSELIITGLLSVTLTVISIVVGLPNNKIYDINSGDIHKISEPKYYNLLHIFIDSCVLFLLSLLLKIHGLKFTRLILESVTIILCFIFGFEQFILIINPQKSSLKIIGNVLKRDLHESIKEDKSNKIKNNRKDFGLISVSQRSIYNKVLRNYIFKEGVETLYEFADSNNLDEIYVTNVLIECMNNYFKELKNYLLLNKNIDLFINNNGISILEAIQKGYENISFIISYYKHDILREENHRRLVDLTLLIDDLTSIAKIDSIKQSSYIKILNNSIFKNQKEKISKIKDCIRRLGVQKEITYKPSKKFIRFLCSMIDLPIKKIDELDANGIEKLSNEEKEIYHEIFSLYLNEQSNNIFYKNLYLTILSLRMFAKGDLTFIKSYKEIALHGLFSEEENTSINYALFITFVMTYLLENKNRMEKIDLYEFFKNFNGIYSLNIESWSSLFLRSIRNISLKDDAARFLVDILRIYNELVFENDIAINNESKSLFNLFNKERIVKYWLWFLLINNSFNIEDFDGCIKIIISNVEKEPSLIDIDKLSCLTSFVNSDFNFLSKLFNIDASEWNKNFDLFKTKKDEYLKEFSKIKNIDYPTKNNCETQKYVEALIDEFKKEYYALKPYLENNEVKNTSYENASILIKTEELTNGTFFETGYFTNIFMNLVIESKGRNLFEKGKFELFVDLTSLKITIKKIPYDVAIIYAQNVSNQISPGLYEYVDANGVTNIKTRQDVMDCIYKMHKEIKIKFSYKIIEK